MVRVMPDAKPAEVRGQLGRFGFSGDMAMREVKALSGGERARLALALITRDAPHVLLLDEPTNHLDVDAREALVQALNAFDGAVIVVSHDRHMLEATADRLVLVADGTAQDYDGTLDDYRDLILGRGVARETSEDKPRTSEGRIANKKEQRRLAARQREQTKSLRDAVKKAEQEMSRYSERLSAIDQALFKPDDAIAEYQGKPMSDLMKLRGDTERKLNAAEARWLEASEALEAAEAA
jgi:ATP-binding cassette subfamily F protein 3